jgi:hemoglobin
MTRHATKIFMKTFTLKTPQRVLTVLTLSVAFTTMVGCGSTKSAKKNDDFFTSGSREADQRATQRMAKEQQLSGEGAGEKDVKKAKPASGGAPGEVKAAQAEGKLTLFDRLGGEQGIAAIMEDFTARALQDPRVDWQRKSGKHGGLFARHDSSWNATPENVATLKKHLVQFLSLATGGPAKYDGREIKSVHAGMHISNPEFDAVLGDLKAALDKAQVPNKEQKELLAIVESTRPQIVTDR